MGERRMIPSLGGRYYASDDGQIFSARHGKARKVAVTRRGYLIVTVRDDGRTTTKLVHKLVAEAFLGPAPVGSTVNHKDGVKANCAPTNLEYVTLSENIQHAWRTGLRHATANQMAALRRAAAVSGSNRRKMTAETLASARARVAAGEQQQDVARSLGVAKSLLSRYLNGQLEAPCQSK